MLQFIGTVLLSILGNLGSHAPRHHLPGRLKAVPFHQQTAEERYYSRSEDWDCFRLGRERRTRCERIFPAGSRVTVLLDRVVEVQ